MKGTKVLSLATDRKTARKFTQQRPQLNDVLYALKSATQAPSGRNAQPWSFLVIDDPKVKHRVREASEEGEKHFYQNLPEDRRKWYGDKGLTWRKPMLEDAPLLVAVLSDTTKPSHSQSTWLSVGYLILALEERGLSSVTYTPSDKDAVKRALETPENMSLETIIPVGYTADTKPKETRKPLSEVTRLNTFTQRLTRPGTAH